MVESDLKAKWFSSDIREAGYSYFFYEKMNRKAETNNFDRKWTSMYMYHERSVILRLRFWSKLVTKMFMYKSQKWIIINFNYFNKCDFKFHERFVAIRSLNMILSKS